MNASVPRILRLADCAKGAALPHMARARALGFGRMLLSVDEAPHQDDPEPQERPAICIAHGVNPQVQREWALGRFRQDPLWRMKSRGELGDRQARPLLWENRAGRVILAGGRAVLTSSEFETMRWVYGYGARTGVNTQASAPNGRAVSVTFYADHPPAELSGLEDAQAILFYLSHRIAHELRDCLTVDERSEGVRLTPRETECMRWVAAGKNAQETAVIMQLSVQTVRDHLKRVRAKLNSTTRAQALMRAASLGLLATQH